MSKLQKAQDALKAQQYGEHAAKVIAEASVNERQRWFKNGDAYLFVDPNTFRVSEVTAGQVPQGATLPNIAEAMALDAAPVAEAAAMETPAPEAEKSTETTEVAAGDGVGLNSTPPESVVETDEPEDDNAEFAFDASMMEVAAEDLDDDQRKAMFAKMGDGGKAVGQAFDAWLSGKAYIDNRGNYHVKDEGSSKGPIAPWNKAVKAKYETVTDFHNAAHGKPKKNEEEESAKPKESGVESHSMRTLYLSELTPLTEAVVDADKKTVEVTLIRPGWSANGKFYGADVLKRDMGIFEGVKAYADHPSKSDETNRPERSVKDITGYYTNVRQADDGSLKATRHFVGDVGTGTIYPLVVEAITNKPDLMGLSINALGKTKLGEVDGRKGVIVEALVKGNSVDDVTTPAAGGKYDRLLMAGDEFTTDLLQALEYDEWRESRPDFVARLKTEMRTARKEELTEAAILEAAQLREQITVLETTHRELAEAKATSDTALSDLRAEHARREGEWVAERKLAELKLPDAWKESIKPQLAGKTAAEIDAVLETERKKYFSFKQPVSVRESGAEGVHADTVITREQAVVTSALGLDPSEAVLEGESPEQWARRLGKIK